MMTELVNGELENAKELVRALHYTHSIPSGKSHWLMFGTAIVVWSIPANKNIGRFLTGRSANVWELSRLWAPNGHERNLLTKAISMAIKWIINTEHPDILVSYADPNVGHDGGVYKAASWLFHGQSEESRSYESQNGNRVARRAFHSGGRGMTKSQIESSGYREIKMPGKYRFVKVVRKNVPLICKLKG